MRQGVERENAVGPAQPISLNEIDNPLPSASFVGSVGIEPTPAALHADMHPLTPTTQTLVQRDSLLRRNDIRIVISENVIHDPRRNHDNQQFDKKAVNLKEKHKESCKEKC